MKTLFAALALLAVPGFAAAQDRAIPVHLDLYKGDRLTRTFADSLTATISGDSRFTVADPLPPDGLNVVMNDSLKPQETEDQQIAGYEVTVKYGSGKFLRTLTGYCDQRRLEMCGRLVAEDIYTSYAAGKK